MNERDFFERLAAQTAVPSGTGERAPARLKARLYSALVSEQAAHGPLRALEASKADGRPLCVFENLLLVVPDARVTSMNPCRVCHARVLAERFESPPIFWPHCPYVDFSKR